MEGEKFDANKQNLCGFRGVQPSYFFIDIESINSCKQIMLVNVETTC